MRNLRTILALGAATLLTAAALPEPLEKALRDCGDPKISRADLLTKFQRLAAELPPGEAHDLAQRDAQTLDAMVTEDGLHARLAQPLASLNPEETIEEWIFRLRDQGGLSKKAGAPPDLFAEADSPAQHLLQLGPAAVPALLEAMGDARLSRIVVIRDGMPSVFTVGDCAAAILSRMAGHPLPDREAAEAWWRHAQQEGAKATLLAKVREGGSESPDMAERLLELDPAQALGAIVAGLHGAKEPGPRLRLVECLSQMQNPTSTAALQAELKSGPFLDARVAAASGLLHRGEREVLRPMIGEWERWKPGRENPARLIAFLAASEDPAAAKALASRFPALPVAVKIQILTDGPAHRQEALAAQALQDRTAQPGAELAFGSGLIEDPRVCDYAAVYLAQIDPGKYPLTWAATCLERDPQMTVLANTWRRDHGQPALPVPAPAGQASSPEILSALRWSGSEAVPQLPIQTGEAVTADALLQTLLQLHQKLPSGMTGFAFSAERAGNGCGTFIAIEWLRVSPASQESALSDHLTIVVNGEPLYRAAGNNFFEKTTPDHGEELVTIAKALQAPAEQSMAIYFDSRPE